MCRGGSAHYCQCIMIGFINYIWQFFPSGKIQAYLATHAPYSFVSFPMFTQATPLINNCAWRNVGRPRPGTPLHCRCMAPVVASGGMPLTKDAERRPKLIEVPVLMCITPQLASSNMLKVRKRRPQLSTSIMKSAAPNPSGRCVCGPKMGNRSLHRTLSNSCVEGFLPTQEPHCENSNLGI